MFRFAVEQELLLVELQIVVTQLHLMPLQSLQSVAQLVTLVGVVAVTIVTPQLFPFIG